MSYFFDASAIIEIINDKEASEKFLKEKIITNSLHMGEVYYFFLREHNKQTADFWLRKLDVELIEPSVDVTTEASMFKFNHKKISFSYVDCIVYISALQNNLVFLTKDNDFKKFENVEFVK
jgi:predicted nucleic acid-binding protein